MHVSCMCVFLHVCMNACMCEYKVSGVIVETLFKAQLHCQECADSIIGTLTDGE